MAKVDVLVTLEFDVKAETVKIGGNAKKEAVEELLADYLHSRVGAGKDETPPEKRDVYHIILGIDLSDDSWFVEHNCGNKGLREGLVMATLQFIKENLERVTWM